MVIPHYEYEHLLALAGQPIRAVRTTSLNELMNRPTSSVNVVRPQVNNNDKASRNMIKDIEQSDSDDNSLDTAEYNTTVKTENWTSRWETI